MGLLAAVLAGVGIILVFLFAVAVRHPRVHLAWLGLALFLIASTIWHVVGNLNPIIKG